VPFVIGLNAVTFGNNRFVAVGNFGTIITSDDGVSWTVRTSPVTISLNGVVFLNGLYIAVGNEGTVITSPDGINWTQREIDTNAHLHDVAFGNGIYVLVGNAGTIFTSPDAITWTNRSLVAQFNHLGVAFGNGTFIIVGVTTVLRSTDGVTWTPLSTPASILRRVAFGAGLFVTFTPVGTLLDGVFVSSNNGTTWTRQTSMDGSSNNYEAIAFGQGRFYLGGVEVATAIVRSQELG